MSNIFFSIVIPTFNGEKTIGKLLQKISKFRKNLNLEVIIIDSSSEDNTQEIVGSYKKDFKHFKFFRIKKSSFNHGDTRNYGVKLAKGRYICFFSQDAVPVSDIFFDYYLRDFSLDKKVIAIYGKHISEQGAQGIQKIEADCFWGKLDPYLNKNGVLVKNIKKPFLSFIDDNKYLWYELSDTSSCYRRDFLLKNPFPKTMYGEDMIMGKIIIDKGLSIVYDTRCSVYHFHSFSLKKYYNREKESINLVVNEVGLKKKSNFICKVKKIFQLELPYFKKLYYLLQLLFYYLIKLIIILNLSL